MIGALALAEAVGFAVRAISTPRRWLLVVAGLGPVFTLLAFDTGTGYVSGRHGDLALTSMSVG